MWQEAKKYYEGNGTDNNGDGTVDIKDYQFQYHRFWHAGDAVVSYGTMALLYPEVKPLDLPTGGEDPTEVEAKLWGDANNDGGVDMSDVVLIMQSLANPNKYGLGGSEATAITRQGLANADVANHGDGVTAGDALRIQEYLLGKVKSLG
jgi:hypothetical protein